jgi:hypothetical protein
MKTNPTNISHRSILPLDFKVLRHGVIKSRIRSMLLDYSSDDLPVELEAEARYALLAIAANEPLDVPFDKNMNSFHAVINRSLFELDVPHGRLCNYDVNCTPLFKRIESADWSSIECFLGRFPAAQSPADQARTMVYRLDPDHPYNYLWTMLPLHYAIICNAPLAIVQLLVKGKFSFVVVIVIRCSLKTNPLIYSQLHVLSFISFP